MAACASKIKFRVDEFTVEELPARVRQRWSSWKAFTSGMSKAELAAALRHAAFAFDHPEEMVRVWGCGLRGVRAHCGEVRGPPERAHAS